MKKMFMTRTPPAVSVVTVMGSTGECSVAYSAEPGMTRPQTANANVAVDVSAAGGLQRCHHALNPLGRGGGLSPGGGGCCCCCCCGGGVAVVVLPFDDPREGVVFPPSPPFPSLPGELSFQLTGSL